jgi:hypothetical protein
MKMNMVKRARMAGTAMVVAGVLTAIGAQSALGAEVGFGQLFLNGEVVGTVVTPAVLPTGTGLDPFFKVTNGVTGQLGIAGVGPGSPDYHGGDWQVWTVTFKSGVTPYLLTSASAVAAAKAKGDVTVARGGPDFRCPITSTAVA